MAVQYKIEKVSKSVTVVDVSLDKLGGSFHVFNMPDLHWDNPKCARELLKKHLDKALALNAFIIIPGDLFCVMQGAYDPRKAKSDIRPEHNVNNYLDAVIETAAEFFKPYAKNLIVCQGNHESAILKRAETDLVERFCERIGAVPMSYKGWVVFRCGKSNDTATHVVKYFFHHGYGGGGPVTRGAIMHTRIAAQVEGADIISMGHIHEKTINEIMVEGLGVTAHGGYKPRVKSVLIMQSSTYKQESTGGGFHIEKGRPAKPLGCTCVEIVINRTNIRGQGRRTQKMTREFIPYFFGTPSFSY